MNNIVENLGKQGAYYKYNGIISCVQSNIIMDEIIEKLKALKDDDSRIAGHTIADFSMAALDILGVEKYNGDDDAIKQLIESKFNF